MSLGVKIPTGLTQSGKLPARYLMNIICNNNYILWRAKVVSQVCISQQKPCNYNNEDLF